MIYRCNNCGAMMTFEEVDWRYEKYDMQAFESFPYCSHCGSDDIYGGDPCGMCGLDIGGWIVGDISVCDNCKEQILADVSKSIDDFAQARSLDYRTAKDWFIAWAEMNW